MDCHMPPVDRPVVPGGPVRAGRRHTFVGSRDVDFLASGLALGSPQRRGHEVAVEVTNLAGHHYPTGEPARALEVRVHLQDDTGQVTATRSEWLARRVLFPERRELWDTTLGPDETRVIRIAFESSEWPARSTIRVEVRYHRLRYLEHARAAAGVSADGVLVTEQVGEG